MRRTPCVFDSLAGRGGATALFAGAILTVAAAGSPALAQQATLEKPAMGALAHASTVPAARALSICPELAGGDLDELEASIPRDSARRTCRVAAAKTLASVDGSNWRLVRYETTYIYPADSIKRQSYPRDTADTSEVLDVVLYSVAGDSVWKPEWHVWADRRITRDVLVDVAAHEGAALVSVNACVNGTGGCDQHFVLRRARRWHDVAERYYQELERRFGKYVFWKGVAVDVRTLRGTVSLYSPGDANCCPSRELLLSLTLHGNELRVRAASARPAAP